MAEKRPPRDMTGVLAFLCLIASVALIWGWKHRGGSVDMALHYALVEYINEHWTWPTVVQTHMGEMNQYPPVSHTVAAGVAFLCGSSFLGLHLVSTVSAAVVLAILFILIRFRTAGAAIFATTLLASVLLVFEYSHAFLGREITGNFLFPQLFGEMCVFALVLLRSRLSLGLATEIITAVCATFVLGWVYPIAAVQLAGIAVAWRLLLMGKHWYAQRRLGAYELFSAAILVVSLVAAIILHPRFQVVRALATNEGWISVRIPLSLVIPATILLCTTTLVLGVEFVRQKLTLRSPDAFVALCGGIAAASLAQGAAYFILGAGSWYGVSKHIFSVSTLLIASIVVGLIHFWRIGRNSADSVRKLWLARMAFVPATLVTLIANNNPLRGEWLSSAVRSEDFLRTEVRQRAGVRKHAVLLGGGRIEQFGFSMGILHLDRERTLFLVYENMNTPEKRRAIIADTPVLFAFIPSAAARDPACSISSNQAARLIMVRYECHTKAAASAAQIPTLAMPPDNVESRTMRATRAVSDIEASR